MNELDLRLLTRLITKLLARVGEEDKATTSIEDRRITSASNEVTALEQDINAINQLLHALDATIAHIEKVGGPDA